MFRSIEQINREHLWIMRNRNAIRYTSYQKYTRAATYFFDNIIDLNVGSTNQLQALVHDHNKGEPFLRQHESTNQV